MDAQFCTNRLFYLALHIWIARSEQDRLTHVYQKWVQNLYDDKFMLLQFHEISFKFLTSYGRNTKCLRKYCRNTEILMLRNFLSPLCLTLMMVKLSSFRLMILLKIISILWIPTPTLKFSVQNVLDFVYGNKPANVNDAICVQSRTICRIIENKYTILYLPIPCNHLNKN